MRTREVSMVLDSGYGSVAVFGAGWAVSEDVGGTVLEWLVIPDVPPTLLVNGGSQFGPYDVTVRVLESEPPLGGSQWEDVAEVSLDLAGDLGLGDIEDGPAEEVPVAPGVYRLRASVRGRSEGAARERQLPDDDLPDTSDVPLEHMLLELWPAESSPAVVVRETSQFARDVVSPPPPDHPAEREAGLEAARLVADDLRACGAGGRLSGRVGVVRVSMEVSGTPTRIYNRLRYADGWPPGNGGTLSHNEKVGDRCAHYGDPPDSDGLAPLLGMLETTVLEVEKPSRFAMSWNWRVAGPDGRPFPTNPRLLDEDSTVVMTFAKASDGGEEPRTRIEIEHIGVPEEWVDALARLWAWDAAVCSRR